MPEEEQQLPRRYLAIRRYDGKTCQPVSAVVWSSIPGREDSQEVWLTHVRPIVRLSQQDEQEGNLYRLIGTVHAALEGAGLLSRANKFISRAYYLGSYEEVLGLAMEEYVEVIR